MRKKFANFFNVLGYIGIVWVGLNAIFIEWLFIRESFINFINPFIHFKVFWVLLHYPSTYVVILFLALGYKLSKDKTNIEKEVL